MWEAWPLAAASAASFTMLASCAPLKPAGSGDACQRSCLGGVSSCLQLSWPAAGTCEAFATGQAFALLTCETPSAGIRSGGTSRALTAWHIQEQERRWVAAARGGIRHDVYIQHLNTRRNEFHGNSNQKLTRRRACKGA